MPLHDIWMMSYIWIFLTIGWNDLLYGRIEPVTLRTLLALQILQWVHQRSFPLWEYKIVIFLMLAVLGIVFFFARLWGGGDAKLLPILGLSIPVYEILPWLQVLSFCGGILAIFWCLAGFRIQRWRHRWVQQERLAIFAMPTNPCPLRFLITPPSVIMAPPHFPHVFQFPYGLPMVITTAWWMINLVSS